MRKIYYNQADSRWAYHSYSNSYHPKATVKSSGCGPTCGAMIVSSCRKIITPDTMCDISKNNGYRNTANGTSDGLFNFIANKWNIPMKKLHSSYEAHEACKQGSFVVIVCGNGLWTTGGHYILAVGANETEIEIYDPYLYNNKFEINNRKGKVRLEGVSAWVQIDTFKEYSNAQRFFEFQINNSDVPAKEDTHIVNKKAWVNTKSADLNVRNSPNGQVISTLAKGTEVHVIETEGGWSHIDQGWVASSYLKYSNAYTTQKAWVNTKKYGLNVRNMTSLSGKIVDNLPKGTQVNVYEENNGWARIGENRWVSNDLLVYEKINGDNNKSSYKLGRYKVVASGLNVRSNSNTNSRVIKTYPKGTIFDTFQINQNWARTPSGWVCLDFCTLLYKY